MEMISDIDNIILNIKSFSLCEERAKSMALSCMKLIKQDVELSDLVVEVFTDELSDDGVYVEFDVKDISFELRCFPDNHTTMFIFDTTLYTIEESFKVETPEEFIAKVRKTIDDTKGNNYNNS